MTYQIDIICEAAEQFEKLNTPKNPLEYLKSIDPKDQETFALLHSLYPYTTIFERNTNDKIMSILFWIRYCVDLGLISYQESLSLIHAIKKSKGLD